MFSIIIPTLNNLKYLKFCIESIKKNSKLKNEIITHVNIGDDGTIDFLQQEKIDFTHTDYNSGICEGINKAAKLAKFNYILYAHDDFYFCPNWDEILEKEVKKIGHNNFYISGTMMNEGQINFNCGETLNDFDEKKFLDNYKNYNYYDFQGSTWAPSLVHRDIWNKVGGLSEEYFPGTGSDPDFNMKLWNLGIRIFKGINDFKVYHFGSTVLRKKLNKISKNKYGSTGGKIFLLKWGISIKFFKKYYLKSDTIYNGPLKNPNKNLLYFFELIKCKLYLLYLKIFFKA
ncbi:glycosyltransferase family 2 protein [Pelagibacterales bacterium SAG-MED30]|nr:glycosyltransferase family 2 protein [Pelagibacterales bacterium SAG-MED30]